MDLLAFRPYLEAAAMGRGVGLERDWTNRRGEQQAAGSRTFALLALAGAVAAAIDTTVVAAGAPAVAGLLLVGYLRTAQTDRGVSTEVAAFATPLTAPLAMPNRIAMGATAIWEPILAVTITVATISGLVRAGGRVYTGAVLHAGPTLTVRDAWQRTTHST